MINFSHLDVITAHFKLNVLSNTKYISKMQYFMYHKTGYKLQCFCGLDAEVKRLLLQ